MYKRIHSPFVYVHFYIVMGTNFPSIFEFGKQTEKQRRTLTDFNAVCVIDLKIYYKLLVMVLRKVLVLYQSRRGTKEDKRQWD